MNDEKQALTLTAQKPLIHDQLEITHKLKCYDKISAAFTKPGGKIIFCNHPRLGMGDMRLLLQLAVKGVIRPYIVLTGISKLKF